MPNNISLGATSTHYLNTSRDGDATTSLGSLFQCLTPLPVKKFFLISKPPPMQLEATASHPVASYLGEETNTCLITTSFQAAVGSNKVPPQSPLLCTHSPEGQPYPGLHQKKHGQHVEGGDSAPLLRSGESPPGVLCPVLEPSAQDRHGPVGAGPEEATEMI